MDRRAALRVLAGFAVLVGLALLPGLAISALGLATVASVATLATLGGMIPALLAPSRVAVITIVALTVASALALPASTNPWLAALLLGAAGGATGLAARVRASGQVVVATISVVFLVTTPPDVGALGGAGGPTSALLVAAIAGGAALWGAIAGRLIRRTHRSAHRAEPDPLPLGHTLTYAALLAAVLGAGGWITVDQQWRHGGGWFLMTFLIILQPSLKDSWTKTLQRAGGTVLGILLAVVLYLVIGDRTVVLYIVGAGSSVLALTVRYATKRPYWQYVALLTPAVVLLEGMRTSITQTAGERLAFTLLAAACAVVIELALLPVARRGARARAPESS